MSLRRQLWRPDTCGCTIEQTHTPDEAVNTVGLSRVVTKCPAHAALTDAEVWDAVWMLPHGENRRKNLVRNRILEQHGIEIVSFSFSGTGKDRVCTVVTSGLNNTQRATLQAWCDTTIGAGKIVIQ